MNEGVEILIDRMKTNPEDFMETDFDPNNGRMVTGKFRWVAAGVSSLLKDEGWGYALYLTKEEIDALKAAYIQLERKNFTARVMSKLLVEEKEQEYGFIAQPVQYQPAMTLGSNGSLGIGTSPGFNGSSVAFHKPANQVTIAPYASGPSIDFNAKNINTLNEMIAKWRGEDDEQRT